ncbi:MAG: YfiR family protein [Bacteroidetes bacterium]|nr:YfiR family protein [Bacteroidota bacterium]
MQKIKNIIIALGAFLFFTAQIKAQVIDSKYEALFIYNFTKNIEWPRNDGHSEFIIGVLGNGEIVTELQLMASLKMVGDRKITIKVFDNNEKIEHCHLLFITKKLSGQISVAQQKLKGMSTLYVTESPGMAQNGSSINLVSKVNKIVFEINTKNIKENGLKISNSLLSLADKIIEN